MRALMVAGAGALALWSGVASAQSFSFGLNADNGNVAGNAVEARNDFIAQLPGTITEGFDDFVPGTAPSLILSVGALYSGSGTVDGTANGGRFPTSGTNFIEFNANPGFTLAFDRSVSAVGFYVSDLSSLITITLSLGGATTATFSQDVDGSSQLAFFGLLDERGFDAITFTSDREGDFAGLDDLIVAAAVPEPGTWAMMIGGFGMVGGAMRRRRVTSAITYA